MKVLTPLAPSLKQEGIFYRTKKAVNAFPRRKPVRFPPKTRDLTGTKSPVHSILSCLFFGKPVGFQKGVCNIEQTETGQDFTPVGLFIAVLTLIIRSDNMYIRNIVTWKKHSGHISIFKRTYQTKEAKKTMTESYIAMISAIAAAVSAVVSLIALIISMKNQKRIREDEKRRLTITDYNKLQEQVLDKSVSLDRANAVLIVESMNNNDKCKKAYNDYKALIARLEHFAVGIIEGVYDYKIVKELGGEHLVYLYRKVQPIIAEANRKSAESKYYCEYRKLCFKMREELNMPENILCFEND